MNLNLIFIYRMNRFVGFYFNFNDKKYFILVIKNKKIYGKTFLREYLFKNLPKNLCL